MITDRRHWKRPSGLMKSSKALPTCGPWRPLTCTICDLSWFAYWSRHASSSIPFKLPMFLAPLPSLSSPSLPLEPKSVSLTSALTRTSFILLSASAGRLCFPVSASLLTLITFFRFRFRFAARSAFLPRSSLVSFFSMSRIAVASRPVPRAARPNHCQSMQSSHVAFH
jgi:hypothetical protein